MDPIWKPRHLREINESATGLDDSKVGALPPSLISMMRQRGYDQDQELLSFLYPKLIDLKDAFSLKGMAEAVDRLERAFAAKEKICIYADFDLDGTSGLALLWTGLTQLGFEGVLRYQPKRLSEGYGFHRSAVEDLHRQGVQVVVTVDVGITAHSACERAQQLGVDVILTDHHLPTETLPAAVAIVNPNQVGDTSGLGYLCGAAVAFTLLRALKKRFHERGWPNESLDLKALLDYFTIATLTDMVPLIGDNRVLVKHGLVALTETHRPGLRALLDALDLSGRSLTSQDVGIRFAPKLNALSRMENGILPIDILLCEDLIQARELVKVVLENNSTRVQLQADAEQRAVALLENWQESDFVFVASETFHRGIVGLIATKLAQQMNRPAFVASLDPQEGVMVGSARLPSGSEGCLVQALGAATDVLTRFGGHSAAAGFELHQPRVPGFVQALRRHFESLRQQPRPLEIQYDLEIGLSELDGAFMKWHDFMGPFGVGFETPLFRFRHVTLRGVRALKGGHLKLQISDASMNRPVEALLFSPAARQREVVEGVPAETYEILGELQWNYYQGQKTLQILVKDVRVEKWQ